MLSSVYIAGKLGAKLGDGIRLVEVEGLVPGPDGAFTGTSIPVYSKMAKRSFFFEAPEGSLIIVKGRLENRPGTGLIVINEIDEIYSNKAGQQKTTLAED